MTRTSVSYYWQDTQWISNYKAAVSICPVFEWNLNVPLISFEQTQKLFTFYWKNLQVSREHLKHFYEKYLKRRLPMTLKPEILIFACLFQISSCGPRSPTKKVKIALEAQTEKMKNALDHLYLFLSKILISETVFIMFFTHWIQTHWVSRKQASLFNILYPPFFPVAVCFCFETLNQNCWQLRFQFLTVKLQGLDIHTNILLFWMKNWTTQNV